MRLKSLILAAAAVLALGSASLAATATKPATTTTTLAKTKTKTDKPADTGAFTKDELKAAVLVSTMKDAKDKFAAAKIDDAKGNVIGPVKDVVIGKTGMPTALHVDVGAWLGVGTRIVSINAKKVSYIQDKDTLITKMSKTQVGKLKAVKGST